MCVLIAWMVLLSCSEYRLDGDSHPKGADTGQADPVAEACDGLDNDGDGLADEDFADAPIWTAALAFPLECGQATIADLDEDGRPEVIAGNFLLDGQTGVQIAGMANIAIPVAAAGDIDLDGDQEVIYGPNVYDHGGRLLWTADIGQPDVWAAIVDSDGDPEAESVMVASETMAVYGHDGREILKVQAGAPGSGAPCVADFDGDGGSEIGWASRTFFNLYELDGSLVWQQPIDDSSTAAGCSAFDLDGDGAFEVLYADEGTFRILDGATGAPLHRDTHHSSVTIFEYPTVADVDGDGSAEIVLASNDTWEIGWSGITVLGHGGAGWAPSGNTWPIHDFAITNVRPTHTPRWSSRSRTRGPRMHRRVSLSPSIGMTEGSSHG